MMATMADIRIDVAASAGDFDRARELIREYADWLGVDLCFQDYEAELAALDRIYLPPMGRMFLARVGDAVAGCMGVRPLSAPGEGELKRLYVRPAYRGLGLGRALIGQSVAAAREIGYRLLRLDTWPPKMPEAEAIYRSLGCVETPPYYNNPVEGVIFLRLDLK